MDWRLGLGIAIALIMAAKYVKSAPKRRDEQRLLEKYDTQVVRERMEQWKRSKKK